VSRDRWLATAAVCTSAVGLQVALVGGCGGASVGPSPAPEPVVAPLADATLVRGARFVATDDGSWIERSEDGTDRLVVGGGRLIIKGRDVLDAGEPDPYIDDGIAMPAWARSPDGQVRYVFWNRRDVYGATEFAGELRHLGRLPDRVRNASPWLDGVALWASGGMSVVDTRGVIRRPRAHGAAVGLAADDSRAVVQTLLGSTLLTIDGGETFRELMTLGDITGMARVGDDLELRLSTGNRRYVVPSGELSQVRTIRIPWRCPPGSPCLRTPRSSWGATMSRSSICLQVQ